MQSLFIVQSFIVFISRTSTDVTETTTVTSPAILDFDTVFTNNVAKMKNAVLEDV